LRYFQNIFEHFACTLNKHCLFVYSLFEFVCSYRPILQPVYISLVMIGNHW